MTEPTTCTAFEGVRCLATGALKDVALAVKSAAERGDGASVLIFDDRTSRLVELDLRGSASDVVKLITSYENSIYGNQHLKSTNGYEQRRQSVLAMGSVKLKAAAAASALALVQTKLMPGESTDGAVFFPTDGKVLGFGHLVVRTNTDVFNFTTD